MSYNNVGKCKIMKIEKLNDKQIKIFLNQTDLEERDIKLSEFAYGSEKAQILFRDMMAKASEECGFYVDTNRFIIEAIPSSIDSIILIITKVSENEDILDKLGIYRNIQSINKANSITSKIVDEDVCVYCFKSLDIISEAAKRLVSIYESRSSLFKYKNTYYLVMNTCDEDKANYINSILAEYGTKQNVSDLIEYFFLEHGEPIIKANALPILASL